MFVAHTVQVRNLSSLTLVKSAATTIPHLILCHKPPRERWELEGSSVGAIRGIKLNSCLTDSIVDAT